MTEYRIIKPSVGRINEKDNLKRIELAGRVCYKSEGKITEDSATKFCEQIIKRGHTSVMEHSNLIVSVPETRIAPMIIDAMALYRNVTGAKSHLQSEHLIDHNAVLFSGNMRAWYETIGIGSSALTFSKHPILDVNDLVDLTPYIISEEALTPSQRYNHSRITLRIVCDRGVSHELVRHRAMSFSQESTRYVNYGKKGYTFVEPWWWEDQNGILKSCMLGAIQDSVRAYDEMLNNGATPQLARAVLPNQIKTEVVVTATPNQWGGFLALRMDSAAHPDMQRVARMVHEALGNDAPPRKLDS